VVAPGCGCADDGDDTKKSAGEGANEGMTGGSGCTGTVGGHATDTGGAEWSEAGATGVAGMSIGLRGGGWASETPGLRDRGLPANQRGAS
jgi:hypothetical protein